MYCHITGFGRSGPRGGDAATDAIVQAFAGVWSAQGSRGEPGELYRHATQVDATTGNLLTQAAILGLHARKRTGVGQYIEVSMLDAAATMQLPRLAEHFGGVTHEPRGSSAFATAPDRAFPCEDGSWIGVSVRLMTETTASLGRPGDEPIRMGTDHAGVSCALYACQAVTAALLVAENGGGQRIDVSLFGALMHMRTALWIALSNPDEWWGFHLDSYTKPPEHFYTCKDRRVLIQAQSIRDRVALNCHGGRASRTALPASSTTSTKTPVASTCGSAANSS